MKHRIVSPLQLGQLLKSARKSLKLNQRELGSRVGLSQARISKMEIDPNSITVEQLLTLMSELRLEFLVRDRTSVELTTGPASTSQDKTEQEEVEW